MRTSRFAQKLAEDDAKRAAEEPETNGQIQHVEPEIPRGPRYKPYRSVWKRLVGKGSSSGCSSCQGEPWGWVQRQITTPRRTVRLLSWLVTLLPRGWELARVAMSKRTDDATYIERQTACGECEACVVVVREKQSHFTEHAYCGACQCPEWRPARLTYKNRKEAWECPRHLHPGPYRGDAVRAEIARRQAEWVETHKAVSLPIVGSGGGGADHA